MLQVTSICWTPKTRSSRSTIFEIWKRRAFEESVESKTDPNDSTAAFSRFTERLGLTECGTRVFEDNDSNEQRAVTTIQGIYEGACLLWGDSEREGKPLPWQTSGFISSSHVQDSCIASCILLDTGVADSYDPPTVQEGVPPPWIVTFLSDFIFLLWQYHKYKQFSPP
jgi:hypothetical protein